MTLSRRELFGLFRGGAAERAAAPAEVDAPASTLDLAGDVAEAEDLASTPAVAAPADAAVSGTPAPAFSLDAFYAARTADRVLPPFAIRATVTSPTTRVGGGRTAPAEVTAAPPADPTPIPPGLAPEVLPHRCLATTSFCSVCVERCPVAGAIVVELGRPRVDVAHCDGCGHCVAACPAPILAFALVVRAPTKGSP